MTWQRAPVVTALVNTLTAATLDAVSVFDHPPPTFNIPAFVVAYVDTVDYNSPAFGIDLVSLPLICAAGQDQPDVVDELLTIAAAALNADITLGGVVQALKVTQQRSWRQLVVGGAEYLAAELALEIRM